MIVLRDSEGISKHIKCLFIGGNIVGADAAICDFVPDEVTV